MNILAHATPGNTYGGFRLAAEAQGHKWVWWEESHTPAFDVFDELKPEMVFFMDPPRALQKCVLEYDTMTVQGYPDQPFSFTAGTKKIENSGLVDNHIFCPGDAHPAYLCEIGIVCEPNPIGLELCRFVGHHNIKIMCEEPWPLPQYLGIGTLENKRDLYRSAKVVLVSDMLEAMRVIACGALPISNNEYLSEQFAIHLSETIPYVTTAEEVLHCYDKGINIDYWAQHIDSLQHTISSNTYDNVLTKILEEYNVSE